MITTGYISFISESGGGYDDNGNPIKVTKHQSEFIGCNLKVIKKEYKTLIDGQYKQASFSIYVSSDAIEAYSNNDLSVIYSEDVLGVDVPFDFVPTGSEIIIKGKRPNIIVARVKSVKLQDNNKNDLGVFQIHNTEYLNLTKRIKIVV